MRVSALNVCVTIVSTIMASNIKEFVLTDNHVKNIIQYAGTWVSFGYELSEHDSLKLRDSHVIGLLSNPDHVDKQKVTGINLDNCKGVTDDSLVFIADHFPQLERLHADNCNISVLPDNFGDKLKHLEWLYLKNNNITTLPASIAKLKHLKVVNLCNNKITTLPISIGELKRLEQLGLSYNNITTLPASISNLTGTCTYFDISENPLSKPLQEATNKGLQGIQQYFQTQKYLEEAAPGNIPNDENFVLTNDHINEIVRCDGTAVNFLIGLSYDDRPKLRNSHVIGLLSDHHYIDTQKVTGIYLYGCKGITDDSLVFIVDHFPQLERLYAINCNISIIPENFGDKLKHLKVLRLHNNNITTLPASIGKLNHLQTLFLNNNKITALPASIGGLNHLKALYLRNNNITTLSTSIANLAITCKIFRIDDSNPLT